MTKARRAAVSTTRVKSLRASRAAVLGTHRNAASLKQSLHKPSITRGEPLRFARAVSPTHRHGKSQWSRAKTSNGFRKVLAMRKHRLSPLGNWRRSKGRATPR